MRPDDVLRGYPVNRCSVCDEPSPFMVCRFCRKQQLQLAGVSIPVGTDTGDAK